MAWKIFHSQASYAFFPPQVNPINPILVKFSQLFYFIVNVLIEVIYDV